MLTIFGRGKKKDEKEGDEQVGQNPVIPNPVQQNAGPPPVQTVPEPYGAVSSPQTPSPEESSLNKLLQSLLQDIPLTPPSDGESSTPPTSTPDWVPPRATPPSRPMIIAPGGKVSPIEPEPSTPATQTAKPTETEQKPPPQITKPTASPVQKLEQTELEVRKPSKPEKPERQEAKPESPKPRPSQAQSFEHVFELTKGTLRTPGFVLINGPTGSGKTSLSNCLAWACLKAGTPCIIVTYDQAPGSLRDKIKQAGWDAGQYESQFRLLLIDGFSSQSDSLSFEPYSVEKPFEMDNVAEIVLRNIQMFMGDKVTVVFDSLTGLASRVPTKEFLTKFGSMVDKVKETGATLVVTLDSSKLTKDVMGPLEDLAACVIDLQRDGQSGGWLNVRKLNGSVSKIEPEEFEIQPGKGLIFV